MRKLGLSICTTAAIVAVVLVVFALDLAIAAPGGKKTLLLFGQSSQVHDGISLDFEKNRFYVKAPGQAARFAAFTDLFTFTRNSVGTLRGSNGLIQYADENTFQFSEAIDNAFWTKNAATVAANSTTAPDGTATADTLTADAGAGTLPRYADTSAQTTYGIATTTASVFAKRSTYDFVQIYINSQSADYANFDVNACTVGTTGTGTARAQPVGNGWCRLFFTWTPLAADRRPFFLISASASATRAQTWSPAGTEAVFFWGNKLSKAQPYVNYLAATGAAVKYDQTRIEYDANGNLIGLLIEGARTNIILQSEDFATTWAATNVTVATNNVAAPDGNTTADTLTASAGNGTVTQNMQASTTNAARTASVYLQRKTGSGNINLEVGASTTTCTVAAVPTWTRCGTIGAAISGTYAVVANVVTVTATAHGLNTGDSVRLDYTSGAAADFSCAAVITLTADTFTCAQTTGDTTGNVTMYAAVARVKIVTNADAVYSWGGQGEADVNAVASSYIPTTTATVPRATELATRIVGNEVSQTSGTMMAQFDSYAEQGGINAYRIGSVNDAATTNYFSLGIYATIAGMTSRTGGVTQADIFGGAWVKNVMQQVGGAFSVNDFQAAVAGATLTADTSGTVPTGMTTFLVGSNNGHGDRLFGHIKVLNYWPVRQPDWFLKQKTVPGPQSSLKFPTYAVNDNEQRKAS